MRMVHPLIRTSVAVVSVLVLSTCALVYSLLDFPLTRIESQVSIHSLGGLFTINDKYLLETGRLDSRYGIIDVSKPESPSIAYSNDTTFGASDAAFLQSGGKTYGYLADYNSLKVVDFSPLPNTAVLLSTPVASGVQRVTIFGHFLYVALDTGVLAFDLASPGAPNQVQSLSFETDASAQTVAGVGADNNLYLVLTRKGADTVVRPFTIASSGILQPVAPYTISDFPGGELAMKGSVALVANGADHLVPIQLLDPAHPSLGTAVDPHDGKFNFDTSFGFSRMTVVNNYLVVYCTGDVVMAIFEISNPSSPVFIFPTLSQDVDLLPAGAQDALCVRPPYIYLAMYQQYLHIYKMP